MAEEALDPAAETALTSSVAQSFVRALRAIEERGDIEEMIGLGDDATRWWSTGPHEAASGPEGARLFWSAYRRSFAEIRSEFTTVTETPTRIVLEWTSHGRHHNGEPVRYTGATALDICGSSDIPELAAVRLYYDTAATTVRAPALDDGGVSMLDRETAASGDNSGLAPRSRDRGPA